MENQQIGRKGNLEKRMASKFSKITKDSNCFAKFCDSCCEFHDQHSGRMIGSVRMPDGLYYFDNNFLKGGQAQVASSSVISILVEDEIMGENHYKKKLKLSYMSTHEGKVKGNTFLYYASHCKEALGHTEWRTTIMEEMQALEKNGTWEIVELPRDKRTVGCKWVFTMKYQADGSIDSWSMHQLDMKNAFLNGELEEEVFMDPPLGFESMLGVRKVCKIAILIVHVDGIILIGKDAGKLEVLKNFLAREFEIKDLEAPRYFLGMEFARSKEYLCHGESMCLTYLRRPVYLVANQ
ncbi:hypothetical protein CK203_057440 [Vitis vinifera]|uniref:Reverse transcriptase Ty1/copia-type domain-containing protein n=1 Tax=Vitis vinifera TaxID=29760 RepID=A0A438GLC8_VITVI|nr:hypothetical protein CK203_057440 [Vitis vinifera]